MAFNFEKLEVWKSSRALANEVHGVALNFPKVELFSLSVQIKKAADSVNLNIAEGSTGLSKDEYRRFLTYSSRSSLEVISCLYLALYRKYIDEKTFTDLYLKYEILFKQINALRNSLGG
ncbi:MAG: four helix bundle protein [Bacteroidota bacterium]